MTDAELAALVKQKVNAGETEWLAASVALQTLAVLQSIDARLRMIGLALTKPPPPVRDH